MYATERHLVSFSIAFFVGVWVLGCAKSRQQYQRSADREVHSAIAERNHDPRWHTASYGIGMNPESRFFEPYNQNCPPSPVDDPSSHRYMKCVDGMKGWDQWDDYGVRSRLDNPKWEESLGQYGPLNDAGDYVLNLDSAVELAYLHSPQNQTQLETLYLSALDVTRERFRLDTQFFGGLGVFYRHNGNVVPAAIQYDGISGNYIISEPFEGIQGNRVTIGTGNSPVELRRKYATAGELLVGFANSFVVEFTGEDVGLANSIANFTFIQPLLRGAGRDVALEQLTFTERNLLANLRAYSQYRQGFYTLVAVGDLGVSGPVRNSRNTRLSVFSGVGGVNGFVGLLQQQQQIRNAEDNLKLQLQSLRRLEAFLETGMIDLVQVEQFRQNIESERVSLLLSKNAYLRSFDNYKKDTLGLPPDTPLGLDDTLIQQFQLIADDAVAVQAQLANQQILMGELDDAVGLEELDVVVLQIAKLSQEVGRLIEAAFADIEQMHGELPKRFEFMDEAARNELALEVESLERDAAKLKVEFAKVSAMIVALSGGADTGVNRTARLLRQNATDAMADLKRLSQNAILIQARARLESVSIEPIELDAHDAMKIALENRLDFMNGRAALVDSWRLIAVSADALQSTLNVTSSGTVLTDRNDPLAFRASTASMRLGLEFDAPFTRLVERNAYRESLINYQRSRRGFIQSHDALQVDLRVILREIKQLEESLEIQRRSVAIAIRRVDLTQARLEAPARPAQPGQRPPQLGPTAAINLISAQASLRDTQNRFLATWLNYYAAKMRLARELGVMTLDTDGKWLEEPLPNAKLNGVRPPQALQGLIDPEALSELGETADLIPPDVSEEFIKLVESLPEKFQLPIPRSVEQNAALSDSNGSVNSGK
ncbi:MAG: hypothetical protein CBE00_07875 [Planctomycetaceae bacterium TMED240]|nr:hypothetical protein [Rhodopirellula sp.]OUX06326.1 MAG: hypothetical protein CBE00_07875 [Planctomycetaceae bacterium TMED240]